MFSRKQGYISFFKTYSLSKLIDVFDKESFVREYVLDNVFVCIFMYMLFYCAVWYAHKVIRRIEEKNQEMLVSVEKNRVRLSHIIGLKNKRKEYEDVVIKAKSAQRQATKQLDSEMKRISSELVSTTGKLNELENFLTKWKLWKTGAERSKNTLVETDFYEGLSPPKAILEDVKVLEPSFPPPKPPEPPPRKYGVFARSPARGSGTPSSPTSAQKIGFK